MPMPFLGGSGAGLAGTDAPYYAPTYFPPTYFYGGAGGDSTSPVDPAAGLTPYNAPTYFPPTYFYGASGSSVVPGGGSPSPLGRDGVSYAALVASLEAAGVVVAVSFGDPSRRSGLGADSYPLAIITPRGWEELDEFDPPLDVRKVSFTVRVAIRVEADAAPFDQLDRLAAVVQKVIDRSDLGGQSLPALTKIRAGRYGSTSRYPEWSIDLDGEFALLIDPSADPVVL